MRTLTNSAMTINYPNDLVFSGDLNRISVTKNTTATHFEISFVLNGYTYRENLYFFSSSVVISLAQILKLTYVRQVTTAFDTNTTFAFTIKLYNNASLIDTENLSITNVLLGQRRVFDKLGLVKNLTTYDFDTDMNLTDFYHYFEYTSDVYAILESSNEFIDNVQGVANIGLSGVVGHIYYVGWQVTNFMLNPNFQYMSGNNYWTTSSFPGCSTIFGVSVGNKLQFTMPDVSCGDTLDVQYSGMAFTEGQQYSVTLNVDTITNPSANAVNITVFIGGVASIPITTTGTVTVFVTAGPGGILKIRGYMDADTSGYGTHGFSITNIVVTDLIQHKIYLNEDCSGVGEKLKLRFKNRFGLWRYYYVIRKAENIGASNGVSLWFSNDNFTELNNLYAEQGKKYSQSLAVYREGLDKETANDLSDIIYADNIHLYDTINSVWIPVKVTSNSFPINDKETLFDVSLNILLQSDNE